jgi:hypothetical protein
VDAFNTKIAQRSESDDETAVSTSPTTTTTIMIVANVHNRSFGKLRILDAGAGCA